METFERIFVAANRWVLILLLSAMSMIVFANVSLRYLTNYSLVWAEEVARYLMIWLTLLGSGPVLRYGGHVAVTNLIDAVPPRWQRALRGFVALSLFAFFVGMVWVGYTYAARMQYQLTPATRISFGYIYSAIPIGFALLGVHMALILRGFVAEGAFKESAALPADLMG